MTTSETLANIIEAIVFVAGKPIAAKDIAENLGVTEKVVLEEAKKLQAKYNETSGINLLIFNKKLQFSSSPVYAEQVSSVLNPIRERELSKSMMEVAAIIAYKQPVTRLDLEEIRGVDSEYAIQNLLKLGVIEVVGRKDAIGRPVLFGTTDEFLKRFQLSSLDDLPDYDQVLSQIQSINTDPYLFKKDTYDASKDPESNMGNSVENSNADIETPSANETEGEQIAISTEESNEEYVEADEDFDLCDISEEELPEHLAGEKVIKIG